MQKNGKYSKILIPFSRSISDRSLLAIESITNKSLLVTEFIFDRFCYICNSYTLNY